MVKRIYGREIDDSTDIASMHEDIFRHLKDNEMWKSTGREGVFYNSVWKSSLDCNTFPCTLMRFEDSGKVKDMVKITCPQGLEEWQREVLYYKVIKDFEGSYGSNPVEDCDISSLCDYILSLEEEIGMGKVFDLLKALRNSNKFATHIIQKIKEDGYESCQLLIRAYIYRSSK